MKKIIKIHLVKNVVIQSIKIIGVTALVVGKNMNRPNYHKQNYCTLCDRTYPKSRIRCIECGHLLRTLARANIRRKTYVDSKVRY